MITVHRFEDFKRSWHFQDLANQPVVVTDATCQFVVMDGYDTMNIAFECTEADFIVIGESDGSFSCFVPAAAFDLPAGDYVFFCRTQFMDGTVLNTVMLEDGRIHVKHLPEPAP